MISDSPAEYLTSCQLMITYTGWRDIRVGGIEGVDTLVICVSIRQLSQRGAGQAGNGT